jgi:predicted amidohydrolase
VQRGHAIANATVVATVNRVGKEGKTTFWGGSFIYSQFGTLISHGGDDEELVIGEVDLSLAERVKRGWRFFLERRPDTYKKLVEK